MAYEDGNPKTGAARNKPTISDIPLRVLFLLGAALKDGEQKYGHLNWRVTGVADKVYVDAMARHLEAWVDGEQNADDSGVHHIAHAIACLVIILDAEIEGTLKRVMGVPVVKEPNPPLIETGSVRPEDYDWGLRPNMPATGELVAERPLTEEEVKLVKNSRWDVTSGQLIVSEPNKG